MVIIVFIVLKYRFITVGIFLETYACVIIYNVFLNHPRTPTSYFVVNLAMNDFFFFPLIYQFLMTIFIRSALCITSDQNDCSWMIVLLKWMLIVSNATDYYSLLTNLNFKLGVLIRSKMLPWDWQWARRWSCVVDEVKALKRELYTFTRLVRDVLE